MLDRLDWTGTCWTDWTEQAHAGQTGLDRHMLEQTGLDRPKLDRLDWTGTCWTDWTGQAQAGKIGIDRHMLDRLDWTCTCWTDWTGQAHAGQIGLDRQHKTSRPRSRALDRQPELDR
jgi:hypothetical protein